MSFLDWLLNPGGLTAHGFCLSWAPGLVALHAGSDGIVGLAYFSIPLALASLARQRADLRYSWVLYLFVAFILACGTTHLMSILTLWVPAYGIEGIIKLVTALLSIGTAVLLWPLMPKLAALPSPAQLEQLNDELSATVEEQTRTEVLLRDSEARVRAVNLELERRVAEQTAELRAANAQLTDALQQRDLLLREVYHRVKNNLQLVDSLIGMQARAITDPQAKDAMQVLRRRVHALGLVHHQLMDSRNLKTFEIGPFLQELSDNLVEASSWRKVGLDVRAMPLDVGLDIAIPLGLIVTELVSNSLKHAFPGGEGHISVVVEPAEDGKIAVIVADDGQGQAGRETQADPARMGAGTGIVATLVEQLRGTMNVQSEHGTRTEIRLAAPVTA